MNIDELQLRPLDNDGVQVLIQWAEQEGWNPGPNDADVFYATDPDGFIGIYHNDEMVGGGSIVSYNGEFGFMGLFIVKPEYRSKGIGSKLWFKRRDTLLSRLKEGAAIGMDGVIDMQPFYAKGGFTISYRDERHECAGRLFETDEHISPITDADTDAILAYDKVCFGFDRPQFMKLWLKLPGTQTFKYIKDGNIKGFAIVRKLYKHYKVCPLFADNGNVAEALYKACLNAAEGDKLLMDVPVTNKGAIELVKRYGATYVSECARMYYGTPPDVPVNKIFGITTFELG